VGKKRVLCCVLRKKGSGFLCGFFCSGQLLRKNERFGGGCSCDLGVGGSEINTGCILRREEPRETERCEGAVLDRGVTVVLRTEKFIGLCGVGTKAEFFLGIQPYLFSPGQTRGCSLFFGGGRVLSVLFLWTFTWMEKGKKRKGRGGGSWGRGNELWNFVLKGFRWWDLSGRGGSRVGGTCRSVAGSPLGGGKKTSVWGARSAISRLLLQKAHVADGGRMGVDFG